MNGLIQAKRSTKEIANFFNRYSPSLLLLPGSPNGAWKDTGLTSKALSDGDALGGLYDFSLNARHATQGTGANQGTWDTVNYRYPSIETSGTSNSYAIANNTNLYAAFVHIFMLATYKGSTADGFRDYVLAGDTGAASPYIRVSATTGLWEAGTAFTGGLVATDNAPTGGLQLIEAGMALNDGFIRVDNRSAVTDTSGTAPASPITRLFSDGAGGQNAVSTNVGMVMVCLSASAFLSATQKTEIRRAVDDFWGLAVS